MAGSHPTRGAPLAHAALRVQSDADLQRLLESLEGVTAARVIRGRDGDIAEVHVLSGNDVDAKRTVRNVGSAIITTLGKPVDHRRISVARSGGEEWEPTPPAPPGPAQNTVVPETPVIPLHSPPRSLDSLATASTVEYRRYAIERDRARRSRAKVVLGHGDVEVVGEAEGFDADGDSARLLAKATVAALNRLLENNRRKPGNLKLDGVNDVTAFGRSFVLVAVHAVLDRETKALAGAVQVEDSRDTAVIAATLQATDRWIHL